jgi:hypothetical protein
LPATPSTIVLTKPISYQESFAALPFAGSVMVSEYAVEAGGAEGGMKKIFLAEHAQKAEGA